MLEQFNKQPQKLTSILHWANAILLLLACSAFQAAGSNSPRKAETVDVEVMAEVTLDRNEGFDAHSVERLPERDVESDFVEEDQVVEGSTNAQWLAIEVQALRHMQQELELKLKESQRHLVLEKEFGQQKLDELLEESEQAQRRSSNEIEELKTALTELQADTSFESLRRQVEALSRELERYREERELLENELAHAESSVSQTPIKEDRSLQYTVTKLELQLEKAKQELSSYQLASDLLGEGQKKASLEGVTPFAELQRKFIFERQRYLEATKLLKNQHGEMIVLQKQIQDLALSSTLTNEEGERADVESSSSEQSQELKISGFVNLNKGFVEQAVLDFEKVFVHEPVAPDLELVLAESYIALGEHEKAKHLLYKLLNINIDNARALDVLSKLYLAEGRIPFAEGLIGNALAVTRSKAQLYNYLGVIQQTQGESSKAIASLEKAVELDPNYGEAHFNLAVLYVSNNPQDIKVARRHYQQAIDLGGARDDSFESLLKL